MGCLPSHMQAALSSAAATASRRSFLAASLLGSACALLQPPPAFAVGPQQADSSEQARRAAEQAIPFDKLRPETRAKLLSVVDRPSLYRRLPLQVIDCDHEMHVFLVRHPEVVVGIWKLMGVTNIQVRRTGDYTLEGSDGVGTTSKIDLVYGTPNLHLFYCEGTYEGPLFKRQLTGRSVLLLRSSYSFDRTKRPLVTDQLDVFLTVDNAGAELIAKSLHTTVGKTVDMNFIESTKFLTRVSEAAERNGPGMQNLSNKLTDCTEQVRTEFSNTSAGVSDRAAERLAALTSPLVVQPDGQILQPGGPAALVPQRR
jgi:hypothetical protein